MKGVLALMMAAVLLVLLAGCEKAPTSDEKVSYLIRLSSHDGIPLENIKIFIYEDPTLSELVSVGTTDEDGCISFMEEPKDAFVAVLKEAPVGYAIEELYSISMGENRILLAQRPLTSEELESLRYGLGDRISDLVVTDCDGNQHSINALLKDKKAVVLNFWFLNCTPCKMEFPYVQEAYDAFGKDVAFLALNPVDGTDETIRNYRWENGLTLPMAGCDPVFQNTFQIMAYPTTFIIDRTGTICLSHTGMFTDSVAICNALKYFTRDVYEQKLFETIEEIPVVE